MEGRLVSARTEGTPQGSPLSQLLSYRALSAKVLSSLGLLTLVKVHL